MAPVNVRRRASANRFVLERKIGSGTFASVFSGKDRLRKGAAVAVKIAKTSGGQDARRALQREAEMLENLRHVNIIASYGSQEQHWKRTSHFALALEFIPRGNAWQFFLERATDRFETNALISQLSSALQYIHGQGVAHMDVKPDNVLIASPSRPYGRVPGYHNLQVKLADFGCSVSRYGQRIAYDETYPFAAPELHSDTRFYADFWKQLNTQDAERGDKDIEELYASGTSPGDAFSLALTIQQSKHENSPWDFGAADIWSLGVTVLWCMKKMPLEEYLKMVQGYDLRDEKESFQDFFEDMCAAAEQSTVAPRLPRMVCLDVKARTFGGL